jgi:hypothetical protein
LDAIIGIFVAAVAFFTLQPELIAALGQFWGTVAAAAISGFVGGFTGALLASLCRITDPPSTANCWATRFRRASPISAMQTDMPSPANRCDPAARNGPSLATDLPASPPPPRNDPPRITQRLNTR